MALSPLYKSEHTGKQIDEATALTLAAKNVGGGIATQKDIQNLSNSGSGTTIYDFLSVPADPDPAYPNMTITDIGVVTDEMQPPTKTLKVYARNGEPFGNFKGEWVSDDEVMKDDIYTQYGNTLMALQDNPPVPPMSSSKTLNTGWIILAQAGGIGPDGKEALTVDTAVTSTYDGTNWAITVDEMHFNANHPLEEYVGEYFTTTDVQSDGTYIATFRVTEVANNVVSAIRTAANKISGESAKKYLHNVTISGVGSAGNYLCYVTVSLITSTPDRIVSFQTFVDALDEYNQGVTRNIDFAATGVLFVQGTASYMSYAYKVEADFVEGTGLYYIYTTTNGSSASPFMLNAENFNFIENTPIEL